MENGWMVLSGNMSEICLYNQVYNEIKRKKKMGEQARFVMHG
jgi:hypothetical protein